MNLKTIFFIFLFSVIAFFVPAQTSAPVLISQEEPRKAPTILKDETIELQLMLADKAISLPRPPYCGIFETDVIVKFKVIRVIRGFYIKNTVLVHEKCLREAIESGYIGDHSTYVYKLKKAYKAPGDTSEETYYIVYF